MTDKTIDFGLITEIEAVVYVTVTGMATITGRLIGHNLSAVVVKCIALACYHFFAIDFLLQSPGPVAGFHDVACRFFVAFKASLGCLRPAVDWPFDKRMVFAGQSG